MNTGPDHHSYVDRGRRTQAAAVAGLLVTLCPCALALNPALDINQYAHTAWHQDFFDNPVQAIAQTPDGYLWMGTEFGLLRFDGVRKIAWNPPAGAQLPSANVTKLLVTRDGRLWIGGGGGLATWKDGLFFTYRELAGQVVNALAEGDEGMVWVGTTLGNHGSLCAVRNDAVRCSGDGGRFGRGVWALFQDSGTLWVGASSGVWSGKPNSLERIPNSEAIGEFSSFGRADDGRLLLATASGVKQISGNHIEPSRIGLEARSRRAVRLLRDRDGGLWIAAGDHGVLHVHSGRTDAFERSDGLSGNLAYAIFEDREGNVWVATDEGVDRFRDFAVPSMSSSQGLASDGVMSVLAGSDGTVWIGGLGLSRWSGGHMKTYTTRNGLPDDVVRSLLEDSRTRLWIATNRGLTRLENGRFAVRPNVIGTSNRELAEASDGSLWITDVQQGLLHLSSGKVVERFSWQALGHTDNSTSLVADNRRGGLWIGFLRGGIAFFKDGQVRESYETGQGLGFGVVESVSVQPDGSVWASTEGGLSRVKDGRVATLNAKNGLPCDAVRTVIEDDDHAVWLYLACGLTRISQSEFEAWVAEPRHTVRITFFDTVDGVRKQLRGGFSPKAAKLPDGQLWFATNKGLSMVDPRHLPFNTLPPPVHIEKIIADDMPYDLKPGLRLPALTRDLQVEYTALSLVAPEKVRFKVKLEGQDPGWMDVGTERHTHYSNLKPRKYRLRVIASNNSGVWNETGDSLEFSVAPAYYQTNWFLALCVAAGITMLWMAYRYRMWQVEGESRRLRDVIETIPAYVWSALPDGAVDFVNRRWLKFTGFSENQALGWGWMDALHLEDRNSFVQKWRAAIISGTPIETEARMRSAEGPYRWLLFRTVPQVDASGKIVKWYGKSTDIDDRKRAEEELHAAEMRFRAFVDHATDVFLVHEKDGKIVDANRQACESLGYTREELIGMHPRQFDTGLTSSMNESMMERLQAGEALTFESKFRRKDESLFPVEVRVRGFQRGEHWYNLSLARDITDRKRAEEELRESETRFRAFVDHASDAFFVLEFDGGTIIDVNRRACESLGYAREELIGKSIFELDADLSAEWLEGRVRPRMEAGENMQFETRHRRKDGSVFPVEIRSRPFWFGGKFVSLALALDITERKRAEEERERMRELQSELAHINRVSMMGELSASVAHEVNQPLSGIVSNAGAALRWLKGDSPDLAEVREALEDIVRDGRRAGDVIARIRSLTKRVSTPREKLDINDTIREVLALIRDEAAKRNVETRTELAEGLPPISGDRVQLQQVLLNLFINAMDAMSGLTDRPRRLVILTREGRTREVEVTVEDSGTGLKPETMAKIFEPFFTTKSGGMGMGLSISRSIIQSHGGTLWATANEGFGTSFRFTLPKYQGEERNAGSTAV